MDYTTVFKDAANTFWKHRSLWLFGIVITIFGQGEYGFRVNYRESVRYDPGQGDVPVFPDVPGRDLLIRFIDNPIPYLIGFGILAVALWLIGSLFCWGAKGALIGMVDEIDRTGSTSVGSGWQIGKHRAVPLTLISILLALPQMILTIPILAGGIWLFLQFADSFRSMLTGQVASAEEMQFMVEKVMPNFLLVFACLFPLLCVSALLGWLLKLLNDVCARSLVLENLGIRESLQRGWEVSRKNTGYVLINGIVLVVLSFLFGFVAGIPALILWIPFAQAILHGNWSALSILGGVLVALYFLIVAFGIGGILNSFNSTLWTKLYKVLTARAEALATDAQPAEPSSSGD